jgi:CHAD domain-containing protein
MQAQLIKFCDKCFLSLTNYLFEIRENCYVDSIHKLRLSIKKIQLLFKIVGYNKGFKSENRLIKMIDRVFLYSGSLRDNHVQVTLLKLYSERVAGDTDYLISILKHDRRRIEKTLKSIVVKISPFDIVLLNQRIDNTIEELSSNQIICILQNNANELLLKMIKSVQVEPDEYTLHQIRIMLKELIYIYSILKKKRSSFEYNEALLISLDRLQLKLGSWHDLYVLYNRIPKLDRLKSDFTSLLHVIEVDKNLLRIEVMDLLKILLLQRLKKRGLLPPLP